MGIEISSAVWGVVGAAVGAAASVGTTWLNLRYGSAEEARRKSDERIEQARAFQRQTLIDLQSAVTKLMDTCTKLVALAQLEQKATGQWAPALQFGEDTASMHREAEMLAERIADDDLRVTVQQLINGIRKTLYAKTEGEALRHYPSVDFVDTNIGIGAILRSHYEPIPPR